jgi:hypothetical protein
LRKTQFYRKIEAQLILKLARDRFPPDTEYRRLLNAFVFSGFARNSAWMGNVIKILMVVINADNFMLFPPGIN